MVRGLLPATLPAVNVAAQLKDSRIVWQSALCNTDLGACGVIVEIGVKMLRRGKMRIARIWSQPQGVFNCCVRASQTGRGVIAGGEAAELRYDSWMTIRERACRRD